MHHVVLGSVAASVLWTPFVQRARCFTNRDNYTYSYRALMLSTLILIVAVVSGVTVGRGDYFVGFLQSGFFSRFGAV